MKPYQIVEVDWVDSLHARGWMKEDEVQLSGDHMLHRTLGYVLRDSKDALLLIQSYQINLQPREVDGVMEIPRVAIKRLRKL